LEPPEDAEVEWILIRVARRVDKLLAARGLAGTPGEPHADEPTDLRSQELSRAVVMPAKARKGRAPIPLPDRTARTARYEGYSLHADVAVHENDRQGLERLCRYGLRPPLALERLARAEHGRLRYRMKRTFSDGTRELLLEPSELLRRLCALIPPPRVHVTRYHGVFAPNARGRHAVTRQGPSRRAPRQAASLPRVEMESGFNPPPPSGSDGDSSSGAPSSPALAPAELGAPPGSPLRARYLPWAELLRRVYEVEVLKCSRCPGRRRVIAFITNAEVVAAILAHLGLPTQPPPLAPARAPPQKELPFAGWADDEFIDPPPGDPA
ncbi:MAG: transposase, partial [Candidatus Rokuibacteriota bacterium]